MSNSREKITKLNIACEVLPDLNKFTNLTSLAITNTRIEDKTCIENLTGLTALSIRWSDNLRKNMPNLDKMTNLTTLTLQGCGLWSEDLEKLMIFSNKKNMNINLQDNSITDVSILLKFDPSTKLNLKENINISEEDKQKLKTRFGNNVSL